MLLTSAGRGGGRILPAARRGYEPVALLDEVGYLTMLYGAVLAYLLAR